jgi:hypothetical protein
MGRKKHKKSLHVNKPKTDQEIDQEAYDQAMNEHYQRQFNQRELALTKVSQPVSQPANRPIATETPMSNRKVKQVKEFQGMVSCIFEHEVVKTTANYEWTGPKITRETWNQMLAFFRWTYATTKSESQVRLFVNAGTQEWSAWAFPQTEGTGMTTRELDNEATKTQRAQFSDADGWFYYGTVHHHCSASAFQSGTDESNERGQDGLHVTIGKIDSDQYDVDARVYQSGYKLVDFDILEFWDAGDVWAGIPPMVKEMLPKDYPKRVALMQMGTPPPEDQAFPEIWKTNLIREVRVVHTPASTYTPYSSHNYYGIRPWTERSKLQVAFDAERFSRAIIDYMERSPETNKVTVKDVVKSIESALTLLDDHDLNVIDMLTRSDVSIDVALAVMVRIDKAMKEEALLKKLEQENPGFPKRKVGRLVTGTSVNGLPTGPTTTEDERSVMDYEGGNHGMPYPGYGGGFAMGG